MNDERLGKEIGSFYRETDVTPPDPRESARQVAARLKRTPQVRRRRWLPAWPPRATHSLDSDQTTDQSTHDPAMDGHGPTVIGRTQAMFSPVKTITAGALVFALGGLFLIAQPLSQPGSVPGAEQDETDPLAPAFVTGDLTSIVESNQAQVEIADEVLREEWEATARLEMDDSRLSGAWSATLGINNYHPPVDRDEGAAETYTGSVAVENDMGTWVGTILGCSGCGDSDAPDTQMVELVGSGGYEGLSALLFATEGTDEGVPFYGVIVTGDLVPELPAE